MRGGNCKNLLILASIMVVVTLGFDLGMPIIPFCMEQLGAGGTELGLLVAYYAVMRLIFGLVWGSLSDRIGRKPVLLIGILGYAATMVASGLATRLWMMFVARILSGILSSATSPTTMAYISDSTPEVERGGGIGMLDAAAGLGTIFGLCSAVLIPAITSLTSKHTTMSQGLTMGLNNSFISLGRIFGGGFVFDFHWGLPFLSGALVMLAGFMASLHGHLQALQPTPLPSPPREQ